MRLSELFFSLGLPLPGEDREILSVTDRPEQVDENTVFVCIRGARFDGHRSAPAAAEKNAAAILCEAPLAVPRAVRAADTRSAFSALSAKLYEPANGYPRLVGVTGTNGKTTTAAYLSAVYRAAGEKCAVIGTLGVSIGGETVSTGYTTPGSDVFFRALGAAGEAGCTRCVAEVSSLALAQRRVDAARFELGVFTNLGSDHLEAHGSRQALLAAKTRLSLLSERMLVNLDDESAPAFAAACGERIPLYYSCRRRADFSAARIRPRGSGSAFTFSAGEKSLETFVPAPGFFSVYNALAAGAAAVATGVPFETAAGALRRLPQVPGRAQMIPVMGRTVCIDYAHTPEALGAMLSALPAERTVAVFGCGGERDRAKRAKMGAAAAKGAKEIVLTSDNPRGEDPIAIMRDVAAGVPAGTPLFFEADRRRAIRLALERAKPGDTVLIAGKGHETEQEINGKRIPFSDLITVKELAGTGFAASLPEAETEG